MLPIRPQRCNGVVDVVLLYPQAQPSLPQVYAFRPRAERISGQTARFTGVQKGKPASFVR